MTVDPKWFSYRELPADIEDAPALFAEMIKQQRDDGAAWARVTVVNDQYPMGGSIPHGLYCEGWPAQPAAGEDLTPFPDSYQFVAEPAHA